MPDIHTLLDTAAGEPVVDVDVPAVLRRAGQRTRRRRTLTTAAVAVPLALVAVGVLGQHDRPERLVPAGPAPSSQPAPSASAPTGPSATIVPPTPGETALADGDVYAFLTGVDATGYGLTYDKADFLGAGCLAAIPLPSRTGDFAGCYRNVNPALRHATASARTTVVLRDSSGEPLPADWAALRREVSGLTAAQLRTRPWHLTVSGGVVVSVVGEVFESA